MITRARSHLVAATLLALSLRVGADSALPPHHHLTARFSVSGRSIEVSDSVRIHVESASVTFALDPRLEVRQVRAEGAAVDFERRGEEWTVQVGASGDIDLSIDYGGVLDIDRAISSTTPSFVDSRGSLLIGNWYPSFDRRPVTYDLDVVIDDPQVAVACGKLVEEHNLDGSYRARFTSLRPAPEIPLFAGPFRVSERKYGSVDLRSYLHPEGADLADLYLLKSAQYLERFERAIGPYDFPHFYVVSSPMPVGYGFAGVAYLSRRIIPLPYVPDTSLGHEVLHSWWGIGVRVAPDSGNWAEGLTTFQADYAAAEAKGAVEARDMRLRWLREYAVLPGERDLALSSFRSREHNASQVVGYHKAAFVFLMLRDMLGRAPFDAGLRDFWSGHRRGSATWSDLRKEFEKHTERPLEEFFRQWIQRSGAPTLGVRNVASEPVTEGYRVRFTLTQDEPAYEINVPIEIETVSSRVDRTVRTTQLQTEFSLTVPDEPVRLRVDSDLRVFRRLLPQEVPAILRGVAFDPEAATLVADRDQEMTEVAATLAESFFDRAPRFITRQGVDREHALLVIGTRDALRDISQDLGLPRSPSPPPVGTARVWAVERPTGPAVVLVEGGASALRQIIGPLPHYGAQSFVVFDGRRAIDKGLWPPEAGPLVVDVTPR